MANLQQIATSLMQTLENNTATVKQAEFYLESASKEENFITILLSIPQIDQVSPQLARIATIYTLTYARNLVLWRNQAGINRAAQQMLQFLAKNTIDFKYKDQVAAALQYLIQKDQNNIIVSAFIPNMIDTLKQAMVSPTNEINFQFLVSITEALADKVVPATGGQIQTYIYQSFLTLSYLIPRVLQLGTALMSTNQEVIQRALLLVTKMLKVLKKYLKKFMYFSQKLTEVLYNALFYQLATAMLNFNLPENTLDTPLFYINQKFSAKKLKQLFHCSKSLIVYLIAQSFRLMISSKNTETKIENSSVVNQFPKLIHVFVNSVHSLLEKRQYFKIDSKQVFKVIQEIYNFLIGALRSGKFYHIFNEIKSVAVFSCIFKTLAFCPEDFQNFYHDPQEFINSIYHVIQVEPALLVGNEKNEIDDEDIDIEIFDTLKTHSANFLKAYVKYIDGVLNDVWFCISNVIEDKLNVQFSKNLMFIVACILRDQIKVRTDFLYNLRRIIFKNFTDLEIPTKKVEEPYNIEYTLSLLVLQKYLILFDEIIDGYNIIQKAFSLSETILKNNKTEQVPRIISAQIINALLGVEESTLYCRRTIQLFNETVTASKLNARYLQCIETILKENDDIFNKDYQALIEMSEKISAFLQNQLKKSQKNPNVISKLWHILEEISDSAVLGMIMAETMKRCLQPLINMINGENQLELQEKVYNIMRKLIKATGQVGQFQIQIFSVLPKTFYAGNKKCSLSTSFALLQLIILNGRQILSSDLLITKNLILLCIENVNAETVNEKIRSETDLLEGVWIIQSLIISIGSIFNKEVWVTITTALTNKLRKATFVYGFVKATIVATLILILQMGYRFFSKQDNELLMQLILKEYHCLTYYQSSKLFIMSISSLLKEHNLPFVNCRFTQLLDITVTLLNLCVSQKKVQTIQINSELDNCEQQYNKLACSLVNCCSGLDQFEFFKSAMEEIKANNIHMLEAAYKELPETKRKYMGSLMNMRRVNDQARVIYRVKNKQWTQMEM